jgi:branched-chain amino acid transport system permease protein
MDLFSIPLHALLAQLVLGLVNGAFYALLSLGLAVIFGLLGIVNFAHGAMYMVGAYGAWWVLDRLGIGYGWALLVAPLGVALLAVVVERTLLRRVYRVEPVYGLLLTFGLALMAEGALREQFGVSGQPYPVPLALQGAFDLGFMALPVYRAWAVAASLVLCVAVWLLIEHTRLGAMLRAGTEQPRLAQALGIDVPRLVVLTYAGGAALAGVAGVLAAPVTQVTPLMGSNLVIVVFAIVVIGGMGSVMGAVLTGLALGVLEGLAKVAWPPASSIVVFVVMAVVLVLRPAGLFGKEK